MKNKILSKFSILTVLFAMVAAGCGGIDPKIEPSPIIPPIEPVYPVPPISDEVDIKSIQIVNSDNEIQLNSSLQLDVNCLPAGCCREYEVTVSDDSVISFEGNILHGIGVGSCDVTVTSLDNQDISDTVTFYVSEFLVTKIKLSVTNDEGIEVDTCALGDVLYMNANVRPIDASNKKVLFTSSNEDVISISSFKNNSCTLLATGFGKSVIRAEASDGSGVFNEIELEVVPTFVSNIILSLPQGKSSTIESGSSFKINATATPIDADINKLVFSSSDASVVSVDQYGNIKALSPGEARVIAASLDGGYKEGFIDFTVTPKEAKNLVIEDINNTNSIYTGESYFLELSSEYFDDTMSFTFESSNENVLVVDSNGKITGVASGNAYVLVNQVGVDGVYAQIEITVRSKLVSSITLSSTAKSLNVNETYQIQAAVSPSYAENKFLYYSSSDSSIATVNANGLVTARKEGTATITVSASDGSNVFEELKLTVTSIPVYTIQVDKENVDIYKGESCTLNANVSPFNASDKTISYASDDETVAIVDSHGVITGVSQGECLITLSSGLASLSVYVNVLEKEVENIIASADKNVLNVGESEAINYLIEPMSAIEQGVNITSSAPDIVEVVDNIITAKKVGSATITVTSTANDSISSTIEISVLPVEIDSILLLNTETMLYVGETLDIVSKVLPENTSYALTYESNNPLVASVDENGKITANMISDEPVTITVNATSKETDQVVSAEIILSIKSDIPTDLSCDVSNPIIKQNDTAYISYVVTPTYAVKDVTFESSNPDIATVSETGLITGVAPGVATIKVTSVKKPDLFKEIKITVSTAIENVKFKEEHLDLEDKNSIDLLTKLDIEPISCNDKIIFFGYNDDYVNIDGNTLTVNDLNGAKKVTNIKAFVIDKDNNPIVTSMTIYINGATEADRDIDPKVSSIDVVPDEISLKEDIVKETYQLNPTVAPESSKNVTYVSNNVDVASVDDSGLITANNKGDAYILLFVKDGGDAYKIVHVNVINDKVSKIDLDIDNSSLRIDDEATVNYQISPSDVGNPGLLWSSSDPNVVIVEQDSTDSVSGSIKIKAVGNGKARIIATSKDGSGVSSYINVEVGNIKVSSIEVEGLPLEDNLYKINLDESSSSGELTVKVNPLDALNQKLSVSTSKSSVATAFINDDNILVINSFASGKAIITLKATDGSGVYAQIEVSVISNKVSEITLDENNPEVELGKSKTVGVTVTPEFAIDKTYSVTVKNGAIANVTIDENNNLVILGKKVGKTDVTLTSNDGGNVSITFTVVVYQIKVSEIIPSPSSISMLESDDPVQIEVSLIGEGGNEPTNKSISFAATSGCISVSSTGLVTANYAGEAAVIIKALDGSNVSTQILVSVTNKNITNITLSGEDEVKVGSNITLTTSYSPVDTTTSSILYEVGDSSIIEIVSSNMNQVVVKGKKVGTTFVRAISTDSDGVKSERFYITVPNVMPTSITISPSTTQTISVNQTIQLNATLLPVGVSNPNVLWSSDDKNIAKVSSSGIVTGVSNGTTTIRCVSQANPSVSASITVKVVYVAVNGITITNKISTMYVNTSHQFTYQFTPANPSNTDLIWTLSGDVNSASISKTGLLTAKSTGVVTVSCVTSDGGKTDSCTVVLQKKYVNKISVSTSEIDLIYGKSIDLSQFITVSPSDATVKSYTLKSTGNLVSVNGTVIKAGSVSGSDTINIEATDGSKVTSKIFVNVIAHARPTINIAGGNDVTYTINIGQSWTLKGVSGTSSVSGVTVNSFSVSDSTNKKTLTLGGSYTPDTAGLHTITYKGTDSTGVYGTSVIYLKVNGATAEGNVTKEENNLDNLAEYGTFKETFADGWASPMREQGINDGQQIGGTSWYMTGGSEAINGNSIVVDLSMLYGHAMNQLFFPLSKDVLPDEGYSFRISFSYKFVNNASYLDWDLPTGNNQTAKAWRLTYIHYQFDGAPSGYDVNFLKEGQYAQGTTYRVSIDMPGCCTSKNPSMFFGFFIFGGKSGFSNVKMVLDDFEISTYKLPTRNELSYGYTWNNENDGINGNYYFTNGETVKKASIASHAVIDNRQGFGSNLVCIKGSNTTPVNYSFSGVSGYSATYMNGITYNNLCDSVRKYVKFEMYLYLDRTIYPNVNFLDYWNIVVRYGGANPNKKNITMNINVVDGESDDSKGIYKIEFLYEATDQEYYDVVFYNNKKGEVKLYIGDITVTTSATPF